MTDRKSEEEFESAVTTAADKVAALLDADVLFYNGALDRPIDRYVIDLCRGRPRRPNVFLIMVTWGGDADAAYRIARCLQSRYEKFSLYVASDCKSAGTLLALGAHEIVFGEDGELGPLDVQLNKEDSLWETQSGLTINTAMTALANRAYLAWEDFFLQIEERSNGMITLKTAAEIAADLTTGLFSPLYAQIDPLKVGEAARAMSVADNYGIRLITESENCDYSGLHHLVSHYPSHGFVIDRAEAETIFKNIREPSAEEVSMARTLGRLAVTPDHRQEPRVRFLSSEVAREDDVAENRDVGDGGNSAAAEDVQLPDHPPAEH